MVVPLVYRHGTAETVYNVALLVWVVFEFAGRVRQHLRSQGPASLDRSAFVLVPSLVAAVVVTQLLGRRGALVWPGGLLWPVVAGLVLMAAGIGLRAWSIATLGRFFQYWIKVQPGHRVVTGGPGGRRPFPGRPSRSSRIGHGANPRRQLAHAALG